MLIIFNIALAEGNNTLTQSNVGLNFQINTTYDYIYMELPKE